VKIKNKTSADASENTSWAREFDAKLKNKTMEIINQKKVTGDVAVNKALEDFYSDKIYKEEEERYRCELCSKMFKAAIFVKKHIETKHAEPVVNPIKRKALDTQFLSNYVGDPNRFLPSSQYISQKEREELRKNAEKHLETEGSPHDRSPRYSSRSPRRYENERSRSPRRGRSSWGSRSPRSRSRSWDRERSPRERSRSRSKRGGNWSSGRSFRGGRGKDRHFRQNRQRIDYSGRDQQDFPADKADPRPTLIYMDLEKVPDENFEIDYESVISVFKKSSKVIS